MVFARCAVKKLFFTALLSVAFLAPLVSHAQTVHQDLKEIVEARVVEIISDGERNIFGTDTNVSYQNVKALLLSGSRENEEVIFENEMTPLSAGDVVYLNYVRMIDGTEYFLFKDFKRQSQLVWLGLMFVGLLVWFGGMQGVRALVSLALSIAAIIFFLVPALLAGYNPALVSLVIAGLILAIVLFFTHGVNPRSLIAFGGTFSAVMITCLMAWFWVSSMRLTGFGDDTAVYLNFSTDGALDFAALLLGGIIIGILGVLDDVSITQASVTQELKAANPKLTAVELYQSAIRVGRDHVGSLVNTLALAYVGVSLPLILLFAAAEADWYLSLNQEVVAAELVRIIVGSAGLVLAVPFTTALAAWYFGSREVDSVGDSSHGHGHTHG